MSEPESAIDGLAAELIAAAEIPADAVERARAIQAQSGGDLSWIMASMGLVTRRQLYESLAEYYGLPLVRDIERLRANVDIGLLAGLTYVDVIRYEFMPFSLTDGMLVIATSHPRNAPTQAFIRERFGEVAVAELLVSDLDLTLLASRTFRDSMVDDAIMGNDQRNPEQSARRVFTVPQIRVIAAILIGVVIWGYLDVRSMLVAVIAVLQLFFLGSVVFKVVLSVAGAKNEISQPLSAEEIAALRDEDLPVYTVLVPVYKEPEVVGQLVRGLENIDYPQHKLDVMLLLEEDDVATLQAARDARPPANWRFIVVPNRQPRTKPKACNYGLAFANGSYLVIYDAEDIPEPSQLKAAVCAFAKNSSDYVCFQAALNYFNAEQNVLTRMFTLEYSYWFDYLIPGLDRLKLPIPLGGTSNHFDVAKLRSLGGWDPFNTTEDADLGIRATAEKYRIGFINSTTFEEANADVGNWIRQRSRWVKGYMQTFLVYWRHPLTLIRTIGLREFLAFNLFIGGTPLTFLVAPPLWALFIFWLLTRSHAVEPLFPDAVLYLALANLLIGNFLGIYLNMIAIYLRKNYALMPYALLNPFYWLLHSIAAYKALGQLFTKPFFWEKTLHGLSRVDTPPAPAGKQPLP
jgi:cellulose synthase/poly-beta-1,6-N-acetylglucosamine synthase-like glycosyltransferase